MEEYRERLATLGRWSATPWSVKMKRRPTDRQMSVVTFSPPTYARHDHLLERAIARLRDALLESGIAEHRALMTRTSADIDAYFDALSELDDALVTFYDLERKGVMEKRASVVGAAEEARKLLDDAMRQMRDASKASTYMEPRDRARGAVAAIRGAVPLPDGALDVVTTPPRVTFEDAASFDGRMKTALLRSRVAAKMKSKKKKNEDG